MPNAPKRAALLAAAVEAWGPDHASRSPTAVYDLRGPMPPSPPPSPPDDALLPPDGAPPPTTPQPSTAAVQDAHQTQVIPWTGMSEGAREPARDEPGALPAEPRSAAHHPSKHVLEELGLRGEGGTGLAVQGR